MAGSTLTDGDAGNSSENALVAAVRERVYGAARPLGVVLALVVLWEVVARFDGRRDVYFPTIEYTVAQTLEFQGRILAGLQATFTEAILGFLTALVIGVTVGIVFAELHAVRQATLPVVVYSYALPHAVMAPLFLLWFGNDIFAIMLFVAWFGFFTIFVNTLTGFTQVDPQFYELGEVFGATRWQMIRKVKFWAAMPHLSSAAKIAVQQSVVGAIIAEFIATGSGLGYTLDYALKLSETGLLFGSLILLMTFAVVFYKTVEFLIDSLAPGPSTE